MKGLVVGGNGFIGSHLVDQLLKLGWEVRVLDLNERRYGPNPSPVHFIKGDLMQSFLVREALVGVELVFHLAWSTIHEVSNRDPVADITTNIIPSIHLIEACHLAGIRRFVFISSGGTVYGPAQQLPVPETHQNNPINAYGISKLAVEKYLYLFYHLYNFEYVILRPSVPYGPRQNPLGRQGAASVFLYRVGNGLPVTIWGDGSVTRDYFYVSDLIEALIAAADQKIDHYRVFNIGGAEEISLIDLLSRVEETVGKKALVDFQPARNFDAARLVLDSRLAYRELNWHPRINLTDGLALTWSWISSTFKA